MNHTQKIPLTLPTISGLRDLGPLQHVTVFVGLHRSSNVAVNLVHTATTGKRDVISRGRPLNDDNLAFVLEFPQSLAEEKRKSLQVEISSHEDVPQYLRFDLTMGAGKVFILEPLEMCETKSEELKFNLHMQDTQEMRITDAKGYLRALELATHSRPHGPFDDHRHFMGVDSQTHPRLVGLTAEEPSDVLWALRLCKKYFIKHAIARARQSNQKEPLTVHQPVITQITAAKIVLNILRDAITTDYGNDISLHARGVERFANGELAIPLADGQWTTRPSSGLFFLFGELAFFGARHDDAEYWTEVARTFVRCQEVFSTVFAPENDPDPRSGSYGFNDYGGCNFCEDNQWSETALRDLATTYAKLDLASLEAQAACNFHRWLPGVLHSPLAPTPRA